MFVWKEGLGGFGFWGVIMDCWCIGELVLWRIFGGVAFRGFGSLLDVCRMDCWWLFV